MGNIHKKRLSLVIPAHNSERVLENSIMEYIEIFSDFLEDFEIIIVCNGCIDGTAEIAKNLAQIYPIQVIEITEKGKGRALSEGFRRARFEIIGFLDVDNPFSSKRIREMVYSLDNCDIAIATKYLRGAMKGKKGVRDSQLRRIVALGGQLISYSLFNLKFRDTQAGAKFFKKNVWDSINKKIICIGFDFDIEFLYRAQKKNFKIAEFYTPLIKYEEFSTVRMKYLPGMLWRLIKLRFF